MYLMRRLEIFFTLKDGKASGPHGFNALFLKKGWEIVGNSVVWVVKSLSFGMTSQGGKIHNQYFGS